MQAIFGAWGGSRSGMANKGGYEKVYLDVIMGSELGYWASYMV